MRSKWEGLDVWEMLQTQKMRLRGGQSPWGADGSVTLALVPSPFPGEVQVGYWELCFPKRILGTFLLSSPGRGGVPIPGGI